MIKKSRKDSGSIFIIGVIFMTVVILGAVGYVAWNKLFTPGTKQETTQQNNTAAKPCKNNEGAIEKDGVVCSEDIGVKFKSPTIFNDKFKKNDNYEIFKGTIDYGTRTSAGYSDVAYSAVIAGTDNFTLTIAKELLRTGYVGVYHGLQNTFYDAGTGILSNVESPMTTYNLANDSSTTTGTYKLGKEVPSFVADNIKFYKGSNGDAGQTGEMYFAVINGSIVKIELKHGAYMGPDSDDPSTIDPKPVFDQLDEAIKNIKIISK
jgi:hypothetical protein